jgi:PPM family protein phosphatase
MVLRRDSGGYVPSARRVFVLVVLLGLVWMAAAATYSRSQQQFYVGEEGGTVTIFRGQNADILGISLSRPYETTDLTLDRLSDYDARTVRKGIDVDSLDDARLAVMRLAGNAIEPPR